MYIPDGDNGLSIEAFNFVFDIVGKITEEVDTCKLLQLVNVDNVGLQRCVLVVLMLKPETYSFVLPFFLILVVVFHVCRREEIAWHDETVLAGLFNLVKPVNCTASTYKKRIVGIFVQCRTNLVLHC